MGKMPSFFLWYLITQGACFTPAWAVNALGGAVEVFPESRGTREFPDSDPTVLREVPGTTAGEPVRHAGLVRVLSLQVQLTTVSRGLVVPDERMGTGERGRGIAEGMAVPFVTIPKIDATVSSMCLKDLSETYRLSTSTPIRRYTVAAAGPMDIRVAVMSEGAPERTVAPYSRKYFTSTTTTSVIVIP